ncbi:hypothetical protein HDU92_003394 [Lobulomyces angularis]|nr:hypothetical protein HDU92_003394 [Lobulomyces angularis]
MQSNSCNTRSQCNIGSKNQPSQKSFSNRNSIKKSSVKYEKIFNCLRKFNKSNCFPSFMILLQILLILLALFIKLWFKEPPPWIIVNFILLFGILFDIPTRSSKKFLFGLKRILTKSEFSLKKFVAIYHFSYFVFLFIFTTLVALEYMITSNLWYVARLSCSAACPTFNDNCLKITDPLLKNQTYLSEHPDCSLNRVTDWQKSMTTLGAISFPIGYLMLVNFFVIHSVATRVVTDINGGDLFASNLDKKLNSLSNSNEMSKRILRTHEDEQNHSGKNLSLKKN